MPPDQHIQPEICGLEKWFSINSDFLAQKFKTAAENAFEKFVKIKYESAGISNLECGPVIISFPPKKRTSF